MNFSSIQLPSLTLFLADHHLHNSTITFSCSLLSKVQILFMVSFPVWHFSRRVLSPSIFMSRQHSLAYLHLKNRWPQSSSNLLHIRHNVSVLTPRCTKFLFTGRLLWANLHKNIRTLLGTLSCHILCH